MYNSRIPVYFMPGMAASSAIFEKIRLDPKQFEVHCLEWFVPEPDMSLSEYAQVLAQKVTSKNPVLIGVSFGGMLVMEMAKFLNPRKVIIISSIKSRKEMPRKMRWSSYLGLHRLMPTRLVSNVEFVARYAFGEKVHKRLELYQKYLSVNDPVYMDWALDQVVNWREQEVPPGLVHIHGDRDTVFPMKYIQDCIPVKRGTHAMIVYRYRWFNEHLGPIILG